MRYTALVSLAAILTYVYFGLRVASAHTKFGVKLPAMTGNPDFERVHRAHVNMLEWMPVFLVPLWLCAFYLSDAGAAVLGVVWIVGRVIYFEGYSKAVEKRIPGFLTQALVCLLLIVGALVGIVMRMVAG